MLKEDGRTMAMVALLSAPPVAYMAFDFFFPNLSIPSLEKNLMVVFLLSILAGMPAGYFCRRVDAALMSVMLYVSVGYLLALLLYSVPFLFYDVAVVLPGFYYMIFVRYTIILLFLFVLGGFIGAVFGNMIQDSIRKDETKLTFESRP